MHPIKIYLSTLAMVLLTILALIYGQVQYETRRQEKQCFLLPSECAPIGTFNK